MATYIRCPECGFCIGKYAVFIDLAKFAVNESVVYAKDSKYAEYAPDKLIFNPSIMPSMEKIFNAVGIKNRCCRMHIMCKTEFDKL